MSVPNSVACAPAPTIICLNESRSVIPLAVAVMNASLISPPARPVTLPNSDTVSVISLTLIPAPSASSRARISESSKVPALSAKSHNVSASCENISTPASPPMMVVICSNGSTASCADSSICSIPSVPCSALSCIVSPIPSAADCTDSKVSEALSTAERIISNSVSSINYLFFCLNLIPAASHKAVNLTSKFCLKLISSAAQMLK